MEKVKNYFEVNVTPERNRKTLSDPSPVLILEKFKGTPSLSFKDVKTGTSSIKGLWIENPNEFIITVVFLNLPSVEHGLTVSDTEFTLGAKANHRVEVKYTPKCAGSWRVVVQVKVWGLPPPHLNFRLVINLSSVEPKVKRKCCQMALPPLRCHNARVMKTQQSTRGKQTAKSKSCCPKHVKGVDDKCFKPSRSKENKPKEDVKLVIGQYGTDRKSGMDRDSLEGDGLPTGHQFTCIEGDVLPPCDVPSTPIRRTTYQVRAEDYLDPNSPHRILQSTARTFTVREEEQLKCAKGKFMDTLDSMWFSPTHIDKYTRKKIEQRKDVDSRLTSKCSSTLIQNEDEEDHKVRCMPNQSSPLIHGASCPLITPATSPIRGFGQNSFLGVGCHDAERGPISTIVNATYIKESNFELMNVEGSENAHFEKRLLFGKIKVDIPGIEEVPENLEMKEKACCLIQRNWRRVMAQRRVKRLMTERHEIMNKACTIIKKNWRIVLANRLADKLRSERLGMRNRSSTVIQKNWRMVLALRLAEKLRSERLELRNRSATMIQKNWRMVLALRLAEKLRCERLELRNRSATVIQKNWRMVLALRLAEKLRCERLELRNRSATVIQKNWRMVLALRLAEKLRSERLELRNRSATMIQKNWRMVLALRLAEKLRCERLELRNRSATVIQKNWRMVLALRLAEKLRCERLELRNRSATVIQKNWRMVLALRLAEKLRCERLELRNRSATVIQKNWRMVLAVWLAEKLRCERLELRNRSATVIQKNWRMVLALRLVEKLRCERLELRNRSATMIQKNWRMVLALRLAEKLRCERLELRNRYATVIQKNWRMVLALRLVEKLRSERLELRNRSATMIQKNWRMVLALRLAEKLRCERLELRNRSATVIQKNWRMVLALRLVEKLRCERLELRNRIATMIQKNWRMVLALRLAEKLRCERLELRNRSATVIQKNWRMVLALRLAEKLRCERLELRNRSATMIQKNWRMVLALRLVEKLRCERLELRNRSATMIQKNWRMVLALRLVEKLRSERLELRNRSATVIQKNWRRVLALRLAEKLISERLEMFSRATTISHKNSRTKLVEGNTADVEPLSKEQYNAMKLFKVPVTSGGSTSGNAESNENFGTADCTKTTRVSAAMKNDFLSKVCENYNLEPNACRVLCELTATDVDVESILRLIREGLQAGKVQSWKMEFGMVDKATQTDKSPVVFAKPQAQSFKKSINVSSESKVKHHSCSYLGGHNVSSRRMLQFSERSITPVKRKTVKEDLKEKKRWSCVAEAVGMKEISD